MGMIPEALCVEAPKCQPMNHRPHPRKQHSKVPREKPEEREERRDPSRWMEGRKLAPPANGMEDEKRTKAVPRPAARKPPENA